MVVNSLKPTGIKRKGIRAAPKPIKRVTGRIGGHRGIVAGGSKPKKRRKKGEITRLKAKLWELCKQITRRRCVQPDGTWICYTSGKVLVFPKDAHTGHCIPSSLCSVELTYDLKNLRVQSYDQNINKNGNPLQFERNLIRDHGQAYMDDLWNRNEATKGNVYPKEWFQNKIQEYQSILESSPTEYIG